MENERPIPDLFIKPLEAHHEPGGSILPVVHFSDHILRRFGAAQVLRLSPDFKVEMRMREVADEAWALLEGSATFVWHDLRPESPSLDAWLRLRLDRPTLALVPFGVAFAPVPESDPCWLLRLMTHEESSPGDRTMPLEDLA